MIAAGIKSADALDELESHLREDIERRMRSTTTEQQAFEEAVRQMGKVDQLKLEFGKVERLRPAVRPRLINLGCAGIGAFVAAAMGWFLLESGATPAGQLLGIIWVTLAGAFIASLPYLNGRVWPGMDGWALRKTIVVICNYTVTAWFALLLLDCENVIHLSLGTMVLPNVIGWPLIAAAVAAVLVYASEADAAFAGFWTPAAQHCLAVAREEARGYHHDFVGTEHVLLGVLESGDAAVSKVLEKMGVGRETIRAEIEKFVATGPQSRSDRPPVYTPRARKSLQLALQEAGSLHSDRVEAPHVFLGLLREGGGVAALVLRKLGVDLERARKEIATGMK